MKGMMDIICLGDDCWRKSNVDRGPLKLPEGVETDGHLIAVGENDDYLHCFVSNTGGYYGIHKSDDPNHLYRAILELNIQSIDKQEE